MTIYTGSTFRVVTSSIMMAVMRTMTIAMLHSVSDTLCKHYEYSGVRKHSVLNTSQTTSVLDTDTLSAAGSAAKTHNYN